MKLHSNLLPTHENVTKKTTNSSVNCDWYSFYIKKRFSLFLGKKFWYISNLSNDWNFTTITTKVTCIRKLSHPKFSIISPTSIKLFGYSNMRQNCFTQMPISMHSFHYCAKSRTRDLFNSTSIALATLPQTCNYIFLCWQITQKSNNLDIFLKNDYIIRAHATELSSCNIKNLLLAR